MPANSRWDLIRRLRVNIIELFRRAVELAACNACNAWSDAQYPQCKGANSPGLFWIYTHTDNLLANGSASFLRFLLNMAY